MAEPYLVSVVMPAYNASETLSESIKSVLSQTYQHLELMVVDDGSTDGSADIADSFALQDGRVRVLRSDRRGVVHARNAATDAASGRMIAFCDSDDLWHPEKLARQVACMGSSGSVISATGFQRINGSGDAISGAVDIPAVIRHADMLVINQVCCASVMYDVSALGKIRMVDYRDVRRLPLYMRVGRMKPLHEDYIAWASILSTGVVIHGINEVLTYYRVRQSSHSARKGDAAIARWYINRNVLGVPFHTNLALFARYAIASVWRRLVWRVASFNVERR